MPEQRLHAGEMCEEIEHMRRKTVAKFVRTNRDRNRSMPQIAFQDQPDRARRNPFPRFIDEERSRMDIRVTTIFRNRFQRGRADWTNAFFPSFSKNSHRLGVK